MDRLQEVAAHGDEVKLNLVKNTYIYEWQHA